MVSNFIEFRRPSCKSGVSPDIKRFPLAGETPALLSRSPEKISSRYHRIFSALFFATFVTFSLPSAHAEEKEEKPKDGYVKIFNATYRNGVEKWETGLNLKFHDEPLANDVRVGEGGLVRQITYKQKDTVDVFRNREFLKVPASANELPATKLSATFEEGSVTLLVVHGEISRNGENVKITALREFPVPEESLRPGQARFVVANFRNGEPVYLSVGSLAPFPLASNEQREIFVAPGETEIFLIHKEPGKSDFKRQLAAFKFKANHNYTGIIFPAAEIPTRPSLRISDSNQDWSGIRASKKKDED
jgi:hypothetical protein